MSALHPSTRKLDALFENGKRGEFIAMARNAKKLLKRYPSSSILLNLAGVAHANLNVFPKAVGFYMKALSIEPNNADFLNNLGNAQVALKEYDLAIQNFKKAIYISPGFSLAFNNLGLALKAQGKVELAAEFFAKALSIDPMLVDSHVHLGDAFLEQAKIASAQRAFRNAIEIDEHCVHAYWNLFGASSSFAEAKKWLQLCVNIDPTCEKADLMLCFMDLWETDNTDIFKRVTPGYRNHPFVRSFSWVLGLSERPLLLFNRWSFYDAVIKMCVGMKPFYEFGVWRGASFRYLLKSLGRGFGFDTFKGLPEAWHDNSQGSYDSGGEAPVLDGGEFIVGEFEYTLPKFFSNPRETASVINFDADLYSSTLCALNYAKQVIDEKTILIFDEMLMNEHWEQDEYRALVEFCDRQKLRFRVLAVCLFSKQVAVALTPI